MYAIKELRLNRYRRVHIKTPKEILSTTGIRPVRDLGSEDFAPNHMSKLDSLDMVDHNLKAEKRESDYQSYLQALEKEREESQSHSDD